MAHLETRILSHAAKVRALYKKALRVMESKSFGDRVEIRVQSILIRKQFEDNKQLTDYNEISRIMEETDDQLEKLLDKKYQFPDSPGGLAEHRSPYVPDWVFDTWHPLDKAKFAGFFARRELAKRDHIEYWEKKYGQESENKN